ncbi:N-acetylmuramoyl-L-alanine amidase [Actinoplanes couchii]|uniref:Peptidoglycan recognition protein family domain-containing protein n=1 Tax=Actinoplanes couchii TaxID=403638 RepID=A0ABQ3X151_9ACTN|nr:N-acetylmuramoyl-L-alanine amidase [Actinoplanes couchii]MDR6316641.1 hypothetical protein [Actinoplanes couchii]GID52255.1 hypothetical protein Aco03nite_006590 [Actinoplanes couchii]
MRRKVAIGLGTATAVLAAGGGVAALTWSSGPGVAAAAVIPTAPPATVVGTVAADPNPAPPRVRSELRTVGLTVSGSKADLPQQATKRFSLLGVTWDDGRSVPDGTLEVRTRSVTTGKWSGWEALHLQDDGPDGTEAAAPRRGATAPLWVGPSDGVAARIAGKGAELPAGLRLDLIDPGSESTGGQGNESTGGKGGGSTGGQGGGEPVPSASVPSATPTGTTTDPAADEPSEEATEPVVEETAPGGSPSPTAGATPEVAVPSAGGKTTDSGKTNDSGKVTDSGKTADSGKASVAAIAPRFPAYRSRSYWSADETIVKRDDLAVADSVQVVWVHHTAHATDANSYSCSAASTIIRAIQKYDVASKKLSDIGYNYLVDKCGNLYEGRAGGVENAVVPAAVVGFNTGYASIAVIGDYDTAASTAAVEKVLAQVAAARLSKYGFDPASQVTLTAVIDNNKYKTGAKFTVSRVAGHQEADSTLCPGKSLTARLPEIRNQAQVMITGLAVPSITGAVPSAGAYYAKKSATVNWTVAADAPAIAGFDVLLDGARIATVAATVRSAPVTVPAGKHTVTVLARQTSGATARVAVVVYGDVTAPTFKATIGLSLRTGTYSATVVPVKLTPNGADNVKLAGYQVSKPKAAALGPVASWATTVKPGASVWTVTAKDVAGNSRAASITRTVTLSPETAAKRTGMWTKKTGAGYLGGKALTASKKNAKLTWTFTGRSASLLFSRAAASGTVVIYVDGKKITTVNLKSAKALNRQAVWTRDLTYGKHTVAIVAQGKPVVSDGMAFIK